MQIHWGTSARKGRESIDWDARHMVNGHALVVGMSGAGKSYTLRKMVKSLIATRQYDDLRVHVMDKHGDLEMENESVIKFNELSEFGLNPLVVNPDPEYGGVRKRVNSVISTINHTSRALGGKQEAVLRNILYDLYESMGFDVNDPATWVAENPAEEEEVATDGKIYLSVPFDEKDEAKKCGARWSKEETCWFVPEGSYTGAITRWPIRKKRRVYPSMQDTLSYARKMLKIAFMGGSQTSVYNLEKFNSAARNLHVKTIALAKKGEALSEDDKAVLDRNKAAEKALQAYTDYIGTVATGRELDDLMKYDSVDVLKSVVERLENLNSIGIFKNKLPRFDPYKTVWRYHIKALEREEQKLFVLFRLQELFQEAVQRGESDHIRDVIIVDEANLFFDEAEDNILNIIALEARKFGVALIAASQTPTHFTEDFIASVATKVILGIDEYFWKPSCTKLQLEIEALQWIKPKKTMLVQMKQTDGSRNGWNWVYFDNAHSANPSLTPAAEMSE